MAQTIHPKQWPQKAKPVRRVLIPEPGKDEIRPLGIASMYERAWQCLVKIVLELEPPAFMRGDLRCSAEIFLGVRNSD